MVLYKGFRHERAKGDDGLRTNYWYLLRADGSEDLAVVGREIKGSGGHYNYNSAPLFGMQSWVNSSEVRRWLQTKIADAQTLRSATAATPVPGQDALYPVPLPSNSSDMHLHGLGQDMGLNKSTSAAGVNDLPWGMNLATNSRAGMDAPSGMSGGSLPVATMLAPLVGAHSGEVGFIADKHQRNAVIGHTVGLIEAQLEALRERTGIDYTMTLVTQERDLHVLGSAAVTMRKNMSPAGNIPESSNMPSPLDAQQGASVREDGGLRVHMPPPIAAPSGAASQSVSQGPDVHPEVPEEDHSPPAWQLQTKRALSDLWNLSELEDSRKRSAPGQLHALPLSMPLSDSSMPM
ncbi:hypothetical protein COCOBI_02-7800 [Coccomyxa sp. Obi]|nr:hypothetical protein COCOBI_02-7800 [Coccomyxa sp. Obi]